MAELPLPEPLARQLRAPGNANRSLLFDRGFDGYDHEWSIPAGEKGQYLGRFAEGFTASADYRPFIERRTKALGEAGARGVPLRNQTRLVIGLGLPHPTETALLLDRLTGCPYVPGSSVKGALRAAAELAADGELDTGGGSDPGFWKEHLERLFGSAAGADLRAKGELVLYDAFPDTWPTLEVDVLTPHYKDYYGDDPENPTVPPADWQDPNPVSFPTVAAATPFTFWIGHTGAPPRQEGVDRAGDLRRAERLLRTALDWLGLGGKTSSGYGIFGEGVPPQPREVEPEAPRRASVPTAGNRPTEQQRPPSPQKPRLGAGEMLWEKVDLIIQRTQPTVRHQGEVARCLRGGIPEDLYERADQFGAVEVDAVVKRGGPGRFRLVRVHLRES